MDENKLFEDFFKYNDDEFFYKELFLKSKNTVEYKKFLKNLNPDFIKKRQLIVPEFNFNYSTIFHFKDDFFDSKIHKNIFLQKHNRFTPAYIHDHEFFEIIYVLSGKCENNIFGTKDVLFQGDLCLMSPAVKHSIWCEDGIIINILIRRSTIQQIFSNIFTTNSIISDFFTNSLFLKNFATCLIFHTNDDKSIKTQILEMFDEQLNSDSYSENIISNMLMIFFNKLLRNYKDTAKYPKSVKKQNEIISQIISMITNNFSITLDDIAKKLGYNISYCSRYIKELTNYNFSELLRKIRLQKAEELLKTTNLSICEISHLCGYENPENFNRAFRKNYNFSPSVFREKNKQL